MSGVGGLLISAAAGYWVLTHAARERGRLKKLGQFLGLIIVAVSIVGAACRVYYQMACPQGMIVGGMMAGKACPFTGKMMNREASSPAELPK